MQCIKRCKSLFVLCFIKAHVNHCNNKAFYLETDFISSENLACHLKLRNTTISCKAWILFGIAECMTSTSSDAPNLIVISKNVCLLYLTSNQRDP